MRGMEYRRSHHHSAGGPLPPPPPLPLLPHHHTSPAHYLLGVSNGGGGHPHAHLPPPSSSPNGSPLFFYPGMTLCHTLNYTPLFTFLNFYFYAQFHHVCLNSKSSGDFRLGQIDDQFKCKWYSSRNEVTSRDFQLFDILLRLPLQQITTNHPASG